jgi:hypothetical protein
MSRRYALPKDHYSGTVAGVAVTHNDGTIMALQGIQNPRLKMVMEHLAVQAALERGFESVSIRSISPHIHIVSYVLYFVGRSIPHSWTVNRAGQKVNDALHMTISAGKSAVAGHIYVSGFNPTVNPLNWYDGLRTEHVKWEDRATSSNASSRRTSEGRGSRSPHAGNGQSSNAYSQASGSASGSAPASDSSAKWVATGSNTPGRQWIWWDGTKYTDTYA